jgi:Tfp pilus assembly protein PilP
LKEGYELEELKLVGVLKTSGARFAMMEDMQGKGLLFKKGDHLNKSTWILDIEDEKILVAYSVKGDIRKVAIDIPRK